MLPGKPHPRADPALSISLIPAWDFICLRLIGSNCCSLVLSSHPEAQLRCPEMGRMRPRAVHKQLNVVQRHFYDPTRAQAAFPYTRRPFLCSQPFASPFHTCKQPCPGPENAASLHGAASSSPRCPALLQKPPSSSQGPGSLLNVGDFEGWMRKDAGLPPPGFPARLVPMPQRGGGCEEGGRLELSAPQGCWAVTSKLWGEKWGFLVAPSPSDPCYRMLASCRNLPRLGHACVPSSQAVLLRDRS